MRYYSSIRKEPPKEEQVAVKDEKYPSDIARSGSIIIHAMVYGDKVPFPQQFSFAVLEDKLLN